MRLCVHEMVRNANTWKRGTQYLKVGVRVSGNGVKGSMNNKVETIGYN